MLTAKEHVCMQNEETERQCGKIVCGKKGRQGAGRMESELRERRERRELI